ncbi:hypothetical protein N7455_010023 [Penicillium solitum]|uniref:uncharacterized protein n=1 Tax=Penicillium solitum TaxID=60172 RepID=UPI0032C48412|nr:hypothetical protein N7455_010023 [Penicillium solitum]
MPLPSWHSDPASRDSLLQMKQPNAIPPKVVTPTATQEVEFHPGRCRNPVLVYRSAVKDWGPLWYCGSQGIWGFMVHAKMGPRLCFIMTRAQGPSHGSNTESGPDNGLWDTTSQRDKVDQ